MGCDGGKGFGGWERLGIFLGEGLGRCLLMRIFYNY